jgi:hypothetical protein
MVVVWLDGQPVVRCKTAEFAPAPERERNALPLLADLRRWGMTYAAIADAIDVDADRVRQWAHQSISPRGEVYHALERLHAAAGRAIADVRG